MKKILLSLVIFLFVILIFSVTLLSAIGYKTNKLNEVISKKIEANNENFSVKLDQIKFKFDIKDLSLFLETQNPTVKYKDLRIPIKKAKVYLDFISLVKSKTKIDKIEIASDEIDINQLKKIIISSKPSNLNSLIANKVNKGKLTTDLELYFKENLKLDNFIAKGKVKKLDAKITNKIILRRSSFNFFFDSSDVLIKDITCELDGLYIKEGSIQITKDNNINVKSDFLSNSKINKNNIKDYSGFLRKIEFLNPEINIDTRLNHNLDIILDKTFKIIDYNYNIKGKVNNFSTKLNKKIEHDFLNNQIAEVFVKDSNFTYSNSFKKKHNISSSGVYSINGIDYEKYEFKSDFLKENLNIDVNLEFSHELKIDLINYRKSNGLSTKIALNLSKNKDEYYFKNLKFSENKSLIEIDNLKINNNNLVSLKKIKVKTFFDDNLNNDFSVDFGKKIVIKGEKYDAKNINKILDNKSKNNILKKINKEIDIRLENIETPLSKRLFNFRLLGAVKNGKFVKISSKGDFGDEKFLDISLKSDKEYKKKYLEIYSDLPQPLLSEYSFFKGLSGGTLIFSSIIENELSSSKLVIDDFKIINAPGVVKLLSLADFGGLADLAEGDGLSFEKLEINMSNNKGFLKLNELFAIGPSISVLMEGYKDTNNLTSLRGTLVPAKNLNRLLSKIPLIGDIIIPKEIGEGLFGVSFKMKGPPGKIKTTINPIKTLTPRFITKALNKSKKSK
tara:strand:- start:4543 stop:6735 length:2193 start_codon:yes stop_codon:yes gene_type:complete